MSLPTDHFTVPGTQRAWRVHTKGTPAIALALDGNLPVPTPAQGEVLVKIQAAALNPMYGKLLILPGISLANEISSMMQRIQNDEIAS